MIGEDLARDQIHYICPALDISPVVAMSQINSAIEDALNAGHQIRLIGSSLGGFYASAVMEQHPRRASGSVLPFPTRSPPTVAGVVPGPR